MAHIYSLSIGLIQTLTSWMLNTSEIPQEHKCAHILELDNGNYAAQPNNRILWALYLSYTTANIGQTIKFKVHIGNAEDSSMVTEDSDNMFYQMEKVKDKKRTYKSYKDYALDMSFENDGKK